MARTLFFMSLTTFMHNISQRSDIFKRRQPERKKEGFSDRDENAKVRRDSLALSDEIGNGAIKKASQGICITARQLAFFDLEQPCCRDV